MTARYKSAHEQQNCEWNKHSFYSINCTAPVLPLPTKITKPNNNEYTNLTQRQTNCPYFTDMNCSLDCAQL